jgi:hypothetical protein
MRRIALGCAVAATVMGIGVTSACDLHLAIGVPETSVDTSFSLPTPDFLSASAITPAAASVSNPAITSWKQNTTGLVGSSPNATINAIVSTIPADVQWVAYNATSAYVNASGVPSHPVGPFPGNPAAPSNRNRTFRIPLQPQPQAGTPTATGLGAIGFMVNGVALYNAADARSYNNQNVWHQNANVVEAASFDTAPGHPAPIMNATGNPVPGIYHYHQSPDLLLNQLDPGNTGQHHSPIIGYALDGYPIYGPYGYANTNGTGAIERIESSFRLRNITTRTTLADGSSVLAGPAVSPTFPLGYYLEDFEFINGSGDLDVHNGRFTVTPEYPAGTYAYFATLDATGDSFFPYLVGSSYYGIVATDNLGAGNVIVPADATLYSVPEPSGALVACGLTLLAARRHRKRLVNRH